MIEWIASLDAEPRRLLGLRVLAQFPLIEAEMLTRWTRSTMEQAPELAPFILALSDQARDKEEGLKNLDLLIPAAEGSAEGSDSEIDPVFAHKSIEATFRLLALLCASGVTDESTLSSEDRELLDAARTLRISHVAKATGVGRNDPCPCGSSKKYKHCCLE
ncbi:MAG: SEC-C domain-containing protein [Deltaproteobacteria bacterium]|nr:SEC-C domain-containing protein [Deltaproteobacteria bacterium]